MLSPEQWSWSKFVLTDGRLTASPDPSEVHPSSRGMVNAISSFYDAVLPRFARGRLLDLGCGKQPLYGVYSRHVDETIAVDWPNSAHDNPHIDHYCDLTGPLPFADAEFDTVLLSDVLEHLPEPQLALNEIARVLRPGGHLLMNTPFMYWVHEQPHDYYRYTRFALDRLCRQAGLDVLTIEELGGGLEVLADTGAKWLHRQTDLPPELATMFDKLLGAMASAYASVGPDARVDSAFRFPLGYGVLAARPRGMQPPARSATESDPHDAAVHATIDPTVILISSHGATAANSVATALTAELSLTGGAEFGVVLTGSSLHETGEIRVPGDIASVVTAPTPAEVDAALANMLEAATKPWILFVSDDLELPAGWFDPIHDYLLLNPDLSAFSPAIRDGEQWVATAGPSNAQGVCLLVARQALLDGRTTAPAAVTDARVHRRPTIDSPVEPDHCFCTIVTRSHFPWALALCDSLRIAEPDLPFKVLVVDIDSTADVDVRGRAGVEVLTLHDLARIPLANAISTRYDRTSDELRWILKPVLLRYLHERYTKAIYGDCDLHFFADHRWLWEELDDAEMLLTPHWRSSRPSIDTANWVLLFTSGLYNAGFVAAHRDAADALTLWAENCLQVCVKDTTRGQWDDQTHLNLLPVLFEGVKVLRHRGCNVANWNQVENQRTQASDGSVTINGSFPIVFIHFTRSTIRGVREGPDRLLLPYLQTFAERLSAVGGSLDLVAA